MKNFLEIKHYRNSGFTIIETMISISLFLVIIMTGMGSLLSANLVHNKSQDMREIYDSLNFIMEDMSRNMRTGYKYRCTSGIFSATSISTPASCIGGGGNMAFEHDLGNPASTADQWVYKIESTDGGRTYNIEKSVDGGATWVQLNPTSVVLDSASGFTVVGAEPPSAGNLLQPFVTIKLKGTITYKDTATPFSLQTAVSQRAIDI